MKQFTLTLLVKTPNIKEQIESDSFLELISRFLLVIATTHAQLEDYKEIIDDDDIPF